MWGKKDTIPNATSSPPEVLAGTEIPGGEGRGRLYLTLHCHHLNDSVLVRWTGSDVSLFNVALIVRGKITRQCP